MATPFPVSKARSSPLMGFVQPNANTRKLVINGLLFFTCSYSNSFRAPLVLATTVVAWLAAGHKDPSTVFTPHEWLGSPTSPYVAVAHWTEHTPSSPRPFVVDTPSAVCRTLIAQWSLIKRLHSHHTIVWPIPPTCLSRFASSKGCIALFQGSPWSLCHIHVSLSSNPPMSSLSVHTHFVDVITQASIAVFCPVRLPDGTWHGPFVIHVAAGHCASHPWWWLAV